MADKGAVELELNALPPEERGPIGRAIKYVMDNWSHGQPDEGRRATNGQWYLRSSTTPSTALTEFSITHGLSAAPTAIYPVLFLDSTNNQLIPLQVTRPADASRVYLRSASTSAVFHIWIEP
jgi:hypothetical protein